METANVKDLKVAIVEGENGVEAATAEIKSEIHKLDDEIDGEDDDACLDGQNALKNLLNDIF